MKFKKISWKRVFKAVFVIYSLFILLFILYVVVYNYFQVREWKKEEAIKNTPYKIPTSRPLLIFRSSPQGYFDEQYDMWLVDLSGNKELVTDKNKFWKVYGPRQSKPYEYQKRFILELFTKLTNLKDVKLEYLDTEGINAIISSKSNVDKKNIYLYIRNSKTYKFLLSLSSREPCDSIVSWNYKKHEVYMATKYDYDSGSYVKEFCIFDDTTGKIISKIPVPEFPHLIGSYLYDELSNRLIIYDDDIFSKKVGAYLMDFPNRTFEKISFPNQISYTIEWATLINGKVLLKKNNLGYAIYDLRSNNFIQDISFPSNFDKQATPLVDISPKYNFLLLSDGKADTCFWIFNILKNEYSGNFCKSKIWKDNNILIFLGWVEN